MVDDQRERILPEVEMGLSGGGAIDAVPRLVLKLEKIHIRMICYVLHCSEHFSGIVVDVEHRIRGRKIRVWRNNNPAHGCSVIPGFLPWNSLRSPVSSQGQPMSSHDALFGYHTGIVGIQKG